MGNGAVVGRQHLVGDLRLGGPLHEEAGVEGRDLLGEALVVEQLLLDDDRAVRTGVARPVQASGQCGIGRVQHGVGGDDPADETRIGVEETEADRSAPVLDDERDPRQADGRDERSEPVDVAAHRVGRTVDRLVGPAEADEVRGHGPQPPFGQTRHDRPVEVRPRGLPVQQENRLGVGRALIDVVHPQPVGQAGEAGREGEPREVVEAFLGCPDDLHVAHIGGRGAPPGGLGW